jgi:GNAT superfamily N-acetyltransferase
VTDRSEAERTAAPDRDADLRTHRATAEELPVVTEIISLAFFDDPVWSWVFPDPETRLANYEVWWRLFIEGAFAHASVWVTGGHEAASIWLPPGEPELAPEQAALVPALLDELIGEHAPAAAVALERFDEHHPTEPFWYLSLLGTHPDHRGHGFGMRLLAENLKVVDTERMPAFLESTNPINHARYARYGFELSDGFLCSDDGPPVATMWRPAIPV